jgi:TRAP-type C4-dicarboxylate transport system permease small subunit
MNRAIYVWISCVCVTLAAVGLCHAGILVLHIVRHNEVGREMFLSLLAAAALPLFFLCFMVVCCICFLKWAIARLFNNDSKLPDFL